jgi:hypothetical protein
VGATGAAREPPFPCLQSSSSPDAAAAAGGRVPDEEVAALAERRTWRPIDTGEEHTDAKAVELYERVIEPGPRRKPAEPCVRLPGKSVLSLEPTRSEW